MKSTFAALLVSFLVIPFASADPIDPNNFVTPFSFCGRILNNYGPGWTRGNTNDVCDPDQSSDQYLCHLTNGTPVAKGLNERDLCSCIGGADGQWVPSACTVDGASECQRRQLTGPYQGAVCRRA